MIRVRRVPAALHSIADFPGYIPDQTDCWMRSPRPKTSQTSLPGARETTELALLPALQVLCRGNRRR